MVVAVTAAITVWKDETVERLSHHYKSRKPAFDSAVAERNYAGINCLSFRHVNTTYAQLADPLLDPYEAFQAFKRHPWIAALLARGQMLEYGAKAVPEGGYHTVPQLVSDGCCLVGDAANLVNGQRLKGIHLAIHSGMLAAEAILDGLRSGDLSAASLEAYPRAFWGSWAGRELRRTRNFHGCFRGGRFWRGAIRSEMQRLLGGWDWQKPDWEHDHKTLRTLADRPAGWTPRPPRSAPPGGPIGGVDAPTPTMGPTEGRPA